MKKIMLTSFAVIFFLFQSNGQISFGVKAGINSSNLTGLSHKNDNYFNSTFARTCDYFGFFSEIKLNKKFSIQPEILGSGKGFGYVVNPASKNIISLNYISIPVLIKYNYTNKLSFLLGPEFNFLIQKSFSSQYLEVGTNNSFNLGIDLGIACKLNKKFGAEVRYCYDFNDKIVITYPDVWGELLVRYTEGRSSVLQAGLFYIF